MSKKIISLLLALVMVTTALVGCNNNDVPKQTDPAATKPTSGEATTPTTPATTEKGLFNETGYPVVNEPVTLTVMCPTDTSRAVAFKDNEAWAALSELTGVQFEFIEVPKGEWNEELSLTLASGELPDIILTMGSSDDLSNNMKVGNIIDLTPYIDAYAPNVKELMGTIDGMTQAITLPTGEIASLPFINMTTETGKCPQSLFVINQNWLDTLGLEIPTTAEELYDVLVAFKTRDPNGNGLADEIPFLPRNNYNMYELFGMFGILVQPDKYFFADGDEIKFSPYMDEFKVGLEYIAKLYQEGLINKDVFTMNNSQVLALGSGETEVVGSSITAAAFVIVGDDRNDDMVLIPEIAAEGYDPLWLNRSIVTAGRFVITKACEYPEVAIRVWDYMFSDEGAKLMWMGTEENYTYLEDGTWTWNLQDGETVENLRARATIQTSLSMAAGYPIEWFKQSAGSETLANEQRYLMGTQYADNLRLVIPSLSYNADVAAERSLILADLNAYVKQAMASFVTGELDIDKDWDDFLKNCEKLRVADALKIHQDAYDAYMGK